MEKETIKFLITKVVELLHEEQEYNNALSKKYNETKDVDKAQRELEKLEDSDELIVIYQKAMKELLNLL